MTSAFMIVASKHMQQTHTRRNQVHVANLHLEFMRKTEVGVAIFTVRDVKIGSRLSNLHLTLSQEEEGSGVMVERVMGYITMTDMRSEEGLSLDTGYRMLPEPLPVSLADLAANKDINYVKRGRDPVAHIRRAATNMQTYLARPSRRPSDFPKAIIDQWVRFHPLGKNGKHTNDSLGYVVDIFPQIVEKYVNPDIEAATLERDMTEQEARELIKGSPPRKAHWYPTLSLNLDVKKALSKDGVEWLFVRVQAYKIQNGRFDLQVTVLDQDGDLVATSSHASLVLDMSRNINKSTRPKENKI